MFDGKTTVFKAKANMSDRKKIIFEAKLTLHQAPADCSIQAPLPQVHVQGDLPYVAPCSKVQHYLMAPILQDDLPNLSPLSRVYRMTSHT
jgi:hypothetical protein